MRRIVIGLLVVAFLSVATATSQTAHAGAGTIAWAPCPQIPEAPPSLRCGTMNVPLDWSKPKGPTIRVSLHLVPATDPQRRIGALFVNPGGPGASAIQVVDRFTGLFPADLRERFDLVGLDPRGVGASTPVTCDPSLQPTIDDLFPRSQAEFDRMVARNRAFGQSCLDRTGPLLSHVDTVSAARDLESVRRALGEPSLNWLGFSYGTAIGNTYAELFPGRVRAIAGDGVLDHSLPITTMVRDEALAAEDGFNRFVDWCATDASCPLHGLNAAAIFDDLTAKATRRPIPDPASGTTVSGTAIRHGVQQFLLTPAQGWPRLAQAIVDARDGDASAFAAASAESFFARSIECLDFATTATSYAKLARTEAMAARMAPHLRGANQSWTVMAGCVGWPVATTNPQRPLRIRGNPPMLYANSSHDPSTSHTWATHVAAVTPRSTLVTYDGDGHTSYLVSPCVAGHINRYLIDRTIPAPNTICAAPGA